MFFKIFEKLNSSKKFPYLICTPLVYGIGAASEHIAIAASYAKKTKKKLLLIKTRSLKKLLKYKVCNNALFDSLVINNEIKNKNLIYKFIDFLIQVEFVIRRTLAIVFKSLFSIDLGEKFRFALLGSSDIYSESKIQNYDEVLPLSIKESKIDLNKKDKEICFKLLKNFDPENNKIVCLHVRDDGYYKDGNRRAYRNSNINNYIELIENLISKDYLVFRLGDNTANKINYDNKRFINYPFTDLKSDLMDLFLIKECAFYIGTPSGPMDTAYLFDKPVLMTNLYDVYPSFPRKKNDRGIFKTVIKKKTGEKLNIKEFANLNINYHQTEVLIEDLQFIENTKEELYLGINEYLKLIEKNFEFEKSQINFNNFLRNRLEEIYSTEVKNMNFFKNNIWKRNEFLRIVKRFKSCEGTYTSSYLNNNLK